MTSTEQSTPSNAALFYKACPVLVTGGAGFIGSNLVRALVRAGATVRVVDNVSSGSLQALADVVNDIEFINGDVRDPDCAMKAAKGCAVIFHLAAQVSVPASIDNPLFYEQVNAGGTLNMLEAARHCKVPKFVYSASSSAYGVSANLPSTPAQLPAPISPYAVSKLAGEYYLQTYCELFGISGVSLRYFNIFGPGQNANSAYAAVIPAFLSALLNDRRPKIFGDGLQTRDFCHIDNVVHANLLAGRCQRVLAGQSVNIGTGQSSSLNDLLKYLEQATGKHPGCDYLPTRAGDVQHSCADIGSARELLGYEPIVDIKRGLESTVAWWCRRTEAHCI
jgi:nucleoside-diphosphate-sugar epimerase